MCETTLDSRIPLKGEMIFLFGDGKISASARVLQSGDLAQFNWILNCLDAFVSMGYNVDGLQLVTPRGALITVHVVEGKFVLS